MFVVTLRVCLAKNGSSESLRWEWNFAVAAFGFVSAHSLFCLRGVRLWEAARRGRGGWDPPDWHIKVEKHKADSQAEWRAFDGDRGRRSPLETAELQLKTQGGKPGEGKGLGQKTSPNLRAFIFTLPLDLYVGKQTLVVQRLKRERAAALFFDTY